jgi:leucyl-tRNA synthetase
MSKSRGNVVNPDEVVGAYGADAMRLFEMFMGPLEEMKPWSTRGVEGVYRFLNRVWRLFVDEHGNIDPTIRVNAVTAETEHSYHFMLKKVGDDIEGLRFNTAISQMMIFVNETMKLETKPRQFLEPFVLVLAPFAPHIAEELWEKLGHEVSLSHQPWPEHDPEKLARSVIPIVLQVNGKIRGKIDAPADLSEQDLESRALADGGVRKHLEGKTLIKAIVVRNRLVNLVVK